MTDQGTAPMLDNLSFLLGEWRAISEPGEPAGGFTFARQLGSHVIVRTNYAEYPATAERPASRHDDLMVIYVNESQGLCADYWDSEGHVIRYSGEVAGGNSVAFTSDLAAPGPRFRLSYRLGNDGVLNGSFEIAMPNKPDSFSPYLSWKAKREQPDSHSLA